jgi:membrane associated rhomboid family serine protease
MQRLKNRMQERIISTVRVGLLYVVSSIVGLLAYWGIVDPAIEIGLREIATILAGLIYLVLHYLLDRHFPWLRLLMLPNP